MTITNYDVETALFYAAKHHAWNAFRLLHSHGAKIELYHPTNNASVLVMAYLDRDIEAIRLLLEHGADLNDIYPKVMYLYASGFSLFYNIFLFGFRLAIPYYTWFVKRLVRGT